jgi:dipeptidyl aminopeptidase/acylaminoacyl peptidase
MGLGLVVATIALNFVAGFSRSEVPAQAKKFTIEQILAPAYSFELVAAKKADRIAWIAFEQGKRNVYTAAAPDFTPVRLTNFKDDDGIDLTKLSIADDGGMLLFVRGHTANKSGWVANPASDPKGGERSLWAIKSNGGEPWKVAAPVDGLRSPDCRWVLVEKNGQIYRTTVQPAVAAAKPEKDEPPLFITFGTNSNPRWSPDSKRIAFVSNRGDHSLIGIYDMDRSKVTYMAPGVDHDSSPAWSEDGKQIAFIRRPGTPFGQQNNPAGKGKGGFKGGFGKGKADFAKEDKSAEPPQKKEAGEPKQIAAAKGLTKATFNGGSTISFWVADTTTGQGREFWHNPPKGNRFGNVNKIDWAGQNVIFSVELDEWARDYSVPIAGGEAEPITLTPGEGMVESTSLSSDGKYLYYCTNAEDIDRRHIWKVSMAGGKPMQLTKGTDIETSPAAIASGNYVAMLFANTKRPQSVAVVSSSGSDKPRVIFPQLTPNFPLEEQVVPQNVTLKAADGLEFHNQLFLPNDLKPGERRPAIVFVHGGPQRQMLLGYHYMHFYHMAYAINQYLANQGYIVLSVNYRSGIGYGKSFRNAPNRGAKGNSEYQDVLAAGQYLKGRADVDPKRIGIWGLSYGGVLTSQALARNSDIFAAGVDMAGIHLWGNSLDPGSVSYQSSSISHIDKWKSPVLLIHGDDDRNVAFSQTTGLVQLLRAHNVPFELIVFPDDVHDFLLFHRWQTSFHATDDFFKRHLKNGD